MTNDSMPRRACRCRTRGSLGFSAGYDFSDNAACRAGLTESSSRCGGGGSAVVGPRRMLRRSPLGATVCPCPWPNQRFLQRSGPTKVCRLAASPELAKLAALPRFKFLVARPRQSDLRPLSVFPSDEASFHRPARPAAPQRAADGSSRVRPRPDAPRGPARARDRLLRLCGREPRLRAAVWPPMPLLTTPDEVRRPEPARPVSKPEGTPP